MRSKSTGMEEVRCLKLWNVIFKITYAETKEVIAYHHCRMYLDEPIDSSEGTVIDVQGRCYRL